MTKNYKYIWMCDVSTCGFKTLDDGHAKKHTLQDRFHTITKCKNLNYNPKEAKDIS